jgi:hypothetical protein
MRHRLIILVALAAGGGTPPSPAPEVLGQISPTYIRQRWQDLFECPGGSRMGLHGECWRKVDVEEERCNRTSSEDDDHAVQRSNCAEQKRTDGWG